MSVTPFTRADEGERQAAFTGMLAHPLVTPWTLPGLFTLVSRHEHTLTQWAGRLGYRLVRINQCFRLRRVPIDGVVAHPRGLPPARRVLVLALLAAAILEDERQDSITLQEISDAVQIFAAVNDFRPYDRGQRRHRVELVQAVRFLTTLGVLEQRTRRADLMETWERDGDGIGAGYVIHRDALVLLVDTRDAELALSPDADPAPATDTRGQRMLRQLVETQALEPGTLTDDETAYLTSQRRRLVDQAEQMTGGVVETRLDAWTLVLPSDQGLDTDLLVAFPEATAADWVALALLDAVGRVATPGPAGRRHADSCVVDALATSLHTEHGQRLTVALRESPAAVREAAETQLRAAGLLDVDATGWTLHPVAGRYRDATLDHTMAGMPPDEPSLLDPAEPPAERDASVGRVAETSTAAPTPLFEELP